jgi:hypothetical protein
VERFSQKSVERSGAVERFSRKNLERSGAVERKFQKISIFLVFFMNFSRIIAQKGPKRSQITPHALARCLGTFLKNIKCNTRYVSKNLSGAERSGGAEYQKIGGAERSWSGPLRSLRSAPLKSRSTAPRILNPGLGYWESDENAPTKLCNRLESLLMIGSFGFLTPRDWNNIIPLYCEVSISSIEVPLMKM